jgi:hypothetical protein
MQKQSANVSFRHVITIEKVCPKMSWPDSLNMSEKATNKLVAVYTNTLNQKVNKIIFQNTNHIKLHFLMGT